MNLNDNLFEPLYPETELEYRNAAGKELEGERAKMKALHSSSALVCNVFQYWRYKNVSIIANACGLASNYKKLKFERVYEKPLGIYGINPHVDIEFTNKNLNPVAVEANFTEPYTRKKKKLAKIYVEKSEIWGRALKDVNY